MGKSSRIGLLIAICLIYQLNFAGSEALTNLGFNLVLFFFGVYCAQQISVSTHSPARFRSTKNRILLDVYKKYVAFLALVSLSALFILSPTGEIQNTSKVALASFFGISNYFIGNSIGDFYSDYAQMNPLIYLWIVSVLMQSLLVILISQKLISRLLHIKHKSVCVAFSFLLAVICVGYFERSFFPQEVRSFYGLGLRGYIVFTGLFTFSITRYTFNQKSKFANKALLWFLFSAFIMFVAPFSNLTRWGIPVAVLSHIFDVSSRHRLLNGIRMLSTQSLVRVFLLVGPILIFIEVLMLEDFSAIYMIFFFAVLFFYWLRLELNRGRRLFFSAGDHSRFLLTRTLFVLFSLILTLLPGAVAKGGGFDSQVQKLYGSKKRLNDDCHNLYSKPPLKSCFTFSQLNSQDPIDFLLVGDSHAAGYSHAFLKSAVSNGSEAIVSTRSGCLPLRIAFKGEYPMHHCESYGQHVRDLINRYNPRQIIIGARWGNYLNSEPRVAGESLQGRSICLIKSSSHEKCHEPSDSLDILSSLLSDFGLDSPSTLKILLLQDYPEYFIEFERCATAFSMNPKCFSQGRDTFDARQSDFWVLVSILQRESKFDVIRTDDFFCSNVSCRATKGDLLLYHDTHHLNTDGSQWVFTSVILPNLQRFNP